MLGPILLHGRRLGEIMASARKVRGRLNHLRDRTRNSPPVMNFLVNDVDSYASEHKMVLNSSKCKCVVLDFLDSTWSPILTGNMVVGRVRTFKLLNVTIANDLK